MYSVDYQVNNLMAKRKHYLGSNRPRREPLAYYYTRSIIQLMAGGGVALIGTVLVPLLSGLFG